MKIQITAKVETFVTMEVEVPDTKPETLYNAMKAVKDDTGTDLVHEQIVEVEMIDWEVSSHTMIEEEPLPDKYHFRCEKCRKVHKMSSYPIAQLASGHSLTHTCDNCGNKNQLEPEMIKEG